MTADCKSAGLSSIVGSSPTSSTRKYAAIAQLVERIHGKDEVTGSNPVRGSIFIYEIFYGNDHDQHLARDGDDDEKKYVGKWILIQS